MKPRNGGIVLLEVLMAMTVLLTGVLVIVQSFRRSLSLVRHSEQEYRAALLMEGAMSEMEVTGRVNTAAWADASLGPVAWTDERGPQDGPFWEDHRLTLRWGQGRSADELALSTFLQK